MFWSPRTRCPRSPFRPSLEILEAREVPTVGGGIWTQLGPSGVDSTTTAIYGPVAGRVNVAVAAPGDGNTVYIGTNDSSRGGASGSGGGVWRSTDFLSASPHWKPLTDNQPSGSIYVHGLTMSPLNSQLLYAAAGGPNGGILRSFDGGDSWTYLAGDLFGPVGFGAIVASPSQAGTVYVAVNSGTTAANTGVLMSTNYGATWNVVSTGFFGNSVTDLAVAPNANPSVPDTLYAGVIDGKTRSGVWKSADGGTTWTHVTAGFLPSSDVTEFVALALAPSDPNTVYAAVFDQAMQSGAPPEADPVLYKTATAGSSWAALPLPKPDEHGVEQRPWHLVLGVDPKNANRVYTNTAYAFQQSDDGGNNWRIVFKADDPVSVYFNGTGDVSSGSGLMFVGDRGINYRPTPSATVQPKAGDLANLLLYNVAVDRTNPATLFATAQDQLATLHTTGSPQWFYVPVGSEIGVTVIDPRNPQRVYNLGSINDPTNLGQRFLQRSTDGGQSWQLAANGLDVNDFPVSDEYEENVYSSLAIDPGDTRRLVLGANRVYETLDGADTWTAISPPLQRIIGGSSTTLSSAIALAPSDRKVIYAATIDGNLFATFDGGATWQERDFGLPANPAGIVERIRVDPHDALRVFVVTAGIGGPGSVWQTLNGGLSWQNLTGKLPINLQVDTIAVDWRSLTPTLYVGTTRNAYFSTDLGTSWSLLGKGLPNVEVRDLELDTRFNRLIAATYGRSAWQITVDAAPATLIVGADAGGAPTVNIYNADTQALTAVFNVFPPSFTGGVRVAQADINGDFIDDYICVAGPGGGPQVTVVDGRTLQMILSFYAFPPSFSGGLYVAAGDFDGDNRAEIVVGADARGGPQVSIFRGTDGTLLRSFYAFPPSFGGGVRVAVGDVNRDGRADIICGAGPGGGPQVSIFDGRTFQPIASFFAFPPSFTGGIYVASYDANNDGADDIICGAGAGGGPQVSIYDGATRAMLKSFFAFPPSFTGGVRVSQVPYGGRDRPALLAAAGPGGGPQVSIFDSSTLALLGSFFAYNPNFRGGSFVG